MWNYNVAEAQHSFALNSEQKQVRVRREQRDFGIFMRKLFIFDLCTRDKCKRRTEEEEGVGGGLCRDGRGRRTAMLNVANNVQEERITAQHKWKSKKCKKRAMKWIACMLRMRLIAHLFAYANLKRNVRFFLSRRRSEAPSIYAVIYLIFISLLLLLPFARWAWAFSIIHSILHLQRVVLSQCLGFSSNQKK